MPNPKSTTAAAEPSKAHTITATGNIDLSDVSHAEELLRAGKALGFAIIPGSGLQPYAIVPPGYVFKEIPRQLEEPLLEYIRQGVRLDDAASFVDYVQQFRTPTTQVFAAAPQLAEIRPGYTGGACFTALLDYHQGGDTKAAARVAHVARYPVPMSLEFTLWLAHSGKAMSQMEFVRFIEENAQDVVSPDSATLMEMALNFESRSTVNFASKVDRVTGSKVLTFTEDVEAGTTSRVATDRMKVPEGLELQLPIFNGGEPYTIIARLEYRPSNGKLNITYHLQRPALVFRTALADMRAAISSSLSLPILTGAAVPQTVEF